MVVLSRPAVPVLVLALVVGALDRSIRQQSGLSALLCSANLPVVGGLFVVATAVSVASRHCQLSEHLVGSAGSRQTAGVAAAASNLMDNLPAAALLSAKLPPHPYSLLLGLDLGPNLGPNLTVVGALSSVLWLRVSRREGAAPSVWTFTKVGAVVTGLTLVGGLLVI
jgi:Na+/H+ antiporter NhaD/arsenite permease-like protein